MTLVADWTIHDDEPRVYLRGFRKKRWLIVLWAEVTAPDGTERLETELRPRKALRITKCADMAASELVEMMKGETVIDAGFRLYFDKKRGNSKWNSVLKK